MADWRNEGGSKVTGKAFIRNSSRPYRRNFADDSDELKLKQNLFLKEKAHTFVTQNKFLEAVTCLEQIDIDDLHEEYPFSVNLLKAECYIQLGRESKATKTISNIESTLTISRDIDPELVISLGKSLAYNNSFVRSMILFRIASKLIKNSRSTPNEIINGVANCIHVSQNMLAHVKGSSSNSIEDLIKNQGDLSELLMRAVAPFNGRNRVIMMDYGVDYMKDMLKDLRKVNGADGEKKALKEAWSITHIGFVLGHLQEFDRSFKTRKEGVELMERTFGDRASNYHVYGVLLHNMGIVMSNKDNHLLAKQMYEKALVAKEMMNDCGATEKKTEIEITRKALDRARKKCFA